VTGGRPWGIKKKDKEKQDIMFSFAAGYAAYGK
jgi:hypothetical protein